MDQPRHEPLWHYIRGDGDRGDEPRETMREIGVRNLFIRNRLGELLDALRLQEIPAITLKGCHLIHTHYPFGVRPVEDIDVLIDRRHYAQADRIIRSLGYDDCASGMDLWTHLNLSNKITYLNQQHPIIPIDVHFSLGPCPYLGAIPHKTIWENAELVDSSDFRSLVLKPEMLLLHLCLHRFQHHYEEWTSSAFDMVAVVRQDGDRLDWDAFIRLVRTHKLVLPVSYAFSRAGELTKLDIPAAVMNELAAIRPGAMESRVFHSSLKQQQDQDRYILQFLTTPRLRVKMQCLKRIIVPGKRFLNHYYNGRYSRYVGHLSKTVIADHPQLLEAVGGWMSGFETPPPAEAPAIRVYLYAYESNERLPFRLPKTAELTHESHLTRYYNDGNLWIVELWSGTAFVNRAANKIVAFAYYRDLLNSPEHLGDFMHPFAELLRQNGVYAHHGAAVSDDGCGLLILGKSGQGKTSLAVDLLDRGFHFLSDDRCFVEETADGGMEAIGFYEPARFFASNVEHISALGQPEQWPTLPNGKHYADVRRLYPDRIIDRSRLRGLVFPFWSPEEESRVEPFPPGQTLMSLLPLTMVCFDPATGKAHFDFSARMARSLPSIKLIMGRDRDNWHKLIREFTSRLP
ncbi:MAG: hypothetical protein K0R75_2082 [Paenibacillaceae bacterium]|nr:hypothetical protein [Paenibacillaceae bacterium]